MACCEGEARCSYFPRIRTILSAAPTSLNWKFRNNIMKRRLRNLYIKDHTALKHKQTLRAVKEMDLQKQWHPAPRMITSLQTTPQ